MIAASMHHSQSLPTVRWASCRNVLMGLVALQMFILVYIGFSAPSVYHHNSISQVLVENHADAAAFEVPKSEGDVVWKDVSNNNKNNNKLLQMAAFDTAGPFDIPGAYFGNFQLERDRPAFRTVALPGDEVWTQLEAKAAQSVPHQPTVRACSYNEQARRLIRPECRTMDPKAKLVAYNPSSITPKSWCGITIAPQAFAAIPESTSSSTCNFDDPVRLFLSPHKQDGGIDNDGPPSSGEGMPPVQFLRTDGSKHLGAPPQRLESCSFPCEVTPVCDIDGPLIRMDCLPNKSMWTIAGTEWTFQFYHNLPGLKVDRKAYRNFSFSASQSFASDIPLSAFDWNMIAADPTALPPPAVDFDTTAKSISLISTETCVGLIRAESWAIAMKNTHELASYGKCLHTVDVPPGLSLEKKEDRQTLLKKHLFALVVEPSLENDFISEALWEALFAGVIPVYYGANNVLDHVPEGSIISASAVGSKDGTAELVKAVANDKAKWETYHVWRKQPFPEHLRRKFEFLKTDPFCRICQWAYAKRYGLGWNHTTQTIQDPAIPRQTCPSQDGYMVRPFRETWYSSLKPTVMLTAADGRTCDANASRKRTITADDSFTITRTIASHDGIVDILIPHVSSQSDEEVILRLDVSIKNWEGAHFSNVHQLIRSPHVAIYSSIAIQDASVRMTVLTNWQTQLRCPTDHGIVEIVVHEAGEETTLANEVRMIRIILEDTSSLRDVMTEYGTSPFAKPLIEDFMDPLELFQIVES